MAGDVFGQRLDRDIHPVLEGHEGVNAPGIVHQHLGAAGMGGAGDGGDVLQFESVAAGAFGVDDLGVGLDECGHAGLVDCRVVEFGLDPPALHQRIGQVAGRAIDAVGHQAMIARFQIGQQRHHHGGEAGADDGGAGAALDLGDHILQRVMGGATLRAIGHELFVALGRAVAPGLAILEQHGGAAMHRGVYEAMGMGAGAAGMAHAGFKGVFLRHVSASLSRFPGGAPIQSRSRHRWRVRGSRPRPGRVPARRR